MKTKIENEKEFAAAIDQFGRAQDDIAKRNDEAKVLKGMIEAYAKENRVSRFKTDEYALRMKKADPSLKRMSEVTESSVVALLKKDESTRDFVAETYNAAAIKSHFAALDDPNDALARYGLYFTSTTPHAEVKRLNA